MKIMPPAMPNTPGMKAVPTDGNQEPHHAGAASLSADRD
jgi:hypothetical protein